MIKYDSKSLFVEAFFELSFARGYLQFKMKKKYFNEKIKSKLL